MPLVVSAPSSLGLRLGFLGFRWLRNPDSSQVSRLGTAVAAGPMDVGRKEPRAVASER